MGNFNRDDRRGGNRDRGGFRGGNRFGGGGDYGRPQMHQATCATCGKPCEVPFRPSGDRPIYCKEHFQKDRGNDSRDRSRDQGGGSGDMQNQLNAFSAKLDRIIGLLESGAKAQKQPVAVKPGKSKKENKAVSKKSTVKKSSVKKTSTNKKK